LSKEIWLGPLLGSNRGRLIDRCAQLVSEGKSKKFLYLAASRPLLDLVTERILDGSRNRGLWGELPVFLFRGFVQRVLSGAIDGQTALPLAPRTPIDREELPLKRSLIAQLVTRLGEDGKLRSFGPLLNRDGFVNTVSKLVGEIQRAARTPEEFKQLIEERSDDKALAGHESGTAPVVRQTDFDREVSTIYTAYVDALVQNQFTDQDADQLRALSILRRDVETVNVDWLDDVELLILDGFFDFTPVQGEMLHQLIGRIPDVIVNLNHDTRNSEIFRPFEATIEQIQATATFEIQQAEEFAETAEGLSRLREKLFRAVELPGGEEDENRESPPSDEQPIEQDAIRIFDCSDRETEIGAIAREIKRLLFVEGYKLSDIALVVRERESYAETIARVMRDESIACNLPGSLAPPEIPAIRALQKLFQLLKDAVHSEPRGIRLSSFADLIKSEYFRPTDEALFQLARDFDENFAEFLPAADDARPRTEPSLRSELGIGQWQPDNLENIFAYVGIDLGVREWLGRARRLLRTFPKDQTTRNLLTPDSEKDVEPVETNEETDSTTRDSSGGGERETKQQPSREVHPASIAWTSLVVEHLSMLIKEAPKEGTPDALHLGVSRLLDQLQFRTQITKAERSSGSDDEFALAVRDLRGLESLRRSIVAAIKSIEVAAAAIDNSADSPSVSMTAFLDEITRCLASHTLPEDPGDRGGLAVLEATDVRGLRFRAIFAAGLVEGGFPLRAPRDWIYPHEEREELKRYGLTLEDISPATLLKEEHYFYQVACRATERLYLTRPLLTEGGIETVGSYYIDEVVRALEPLQIKRETIRRDYDGSEVLSASTRAGLSLSLTRQDERRRAGIQTDGLLPPQLLERFLTWAGEQNAISGAALNRIGIQRERAGRQFGRFDGQITDQRLAAMLQNHFGPHYLHSASGLSLYGICPFRFFASRVLKLEPRSEAALDLQALDAGALLHEVLRRFFERHRNQRLDSHQLDSLRRELADIADRVFDEHERIVPPLNPHIWKIDREIRKLLLDQVLIFELDVQAKTESENVRPAFFEVAFGMSPDQPTDPVSTTDPLELERTAGGEKIAIKGQIDRVDVAEDGTLVAYDYKLSGGANVDDMRTGRALQMPIYLEALERLVLPDRSIAGGGYYAIRGGTDRRNRGIYRADLSNYTGIGNTRSNVSDQLWEQTRTEVIAKIWDFLDGMRAGRFVVTPAESYKTCSVCDFSAVCRYDKFRIERKLRAVGQ
jgi:ATP-dependent helicase/DNAse subunit B